MSNLNHIPGLTASEDLSSHQYHAVQISGVRTVATLDNANAPEVPIGILQDDPTSGDPAEVAGPGSIGLDPCNHPVGEGS